MILSFDAATSKRKAKFLLSLYCTPPPNPVRQFLELNLSLTRIAGSVFDLLSPQTCPTSVKTIRSSPFVLSSFCAQMVRRISPAKMSALLARKRKLRKPRR